MIIRNHILFTDMVALGVTTQAIRLTAPVIKAHQLDIGAINIEDR